MKKLTTENMIMRFYEKWKNKKLNKAAQQTLKKNPQLQKDLEKLDSTLKDIANDLKKGYAPY
jgi:uncharacterized protein YlxW (UPF0749 family)|tara:strand:+ start:164 stop:349 length:186 start_codon:yes stop_codon:yes gene_type:complete